MSQPCAYQIARGMKRRASMFPPTKHGSPEMSFEALPRRIVNPLDPRRGPHSKTVKTIAHV